MNRHHSFLSIYMLLVMALLLSAFVSCNGFSFDDEKNESKKGYIYISLASPRTVSPQIDTANALFTLIGSKSGETVTLIENSSLSSFEEKPIAIDTGTWSFKLSTKINNITFSDTKDSVISTDDAVRLSFRLAAQNAETTGSFSITLNLTSTSAKRARGFCTNIESDNGEELTITDNSVTFSRSNIAEGEYTAKIIVYGGESSDVVLNTYTTTVRIANGLTSSTEENYTLNENSRVVYLNANTGNDESGNGSESAPYQTLDKALAHFAKYKKAAWTLYVTGEITATNENLNVIYDIENYATSLTIDGGSNESAFFNGGASCRGLEIQTSTPIILKNIKITGTASGNAGGLSVCAGLTPTVAGNVEIADGVLITDCTANSNGGGVYIAEGSTVRMSGGVITNNFAMQKGGGIYNEGTLFMYGSALVGDSTATCANDTSYSNKSASGGAGIYNKGSLYLGYSDIDTEEELTGGVCRNYTTITASGAGIYNTGTGGTFKIASGNISYNYAQKGAGIYTEKVTSMSGGCIEGNQCPNSESAGAGVYVDASVDFELSGGEIKNNTNAYQGGGIFLSIGSNLIMTGGTISDNTAKSQGGAIFMNYTNPSPNDTGSNNMAKLQIGGSAYIPSSNDVYVKGESGVSTKLYTRITVISALTKTKTRSVATISVDLPLDNSIALVEASDGVTFTDTTFAISNSGYYIDTDGIIKAMN